MENLLSILSFRGGTKSSRKNEKKRVEEGVLPFETSIDLNSHERRDFTPTEDIKNPRKSVSFKQKITAKFVTFMSLVGVRASEFKTHWLLPERGSGSEKSRLRHLVERKYHEHKYTLFGLVMLSIFLVFTFNVAKLGWKYVYINQYVDANNNTINDPFLFEESEDAWNLQYNLHDRGLVGWVQQQRLPDPPVLNQNNVTLGFFTTKVLGQQDRAWNISFEMLLMKFRKYAPELGACLRADNFGIPHNILYFVSKEEDSNTEYMLIEPTVNAGDHSTEQNKIRYFMRDNLDPDTRIEYTALCPQQLRAHWVSYKTGNLVSKVFYEYEAACICRFGMTR